MKSRINLLAKSCLFLIVIFSFKATMVLPIGSDLPKPGLKLLDVNGKKISFNEVKKQNGLLIMFSCNTCPFVIRNQQRTKAICAYALKNNIGVILLNANEGERANDESYTAMQAYALQQGYQWYYVVDKNNEIADELGAKRTPECFLFNKALRLSYHGAIDDNPGDEANVTNHYLEMAITEMTDGKEISQKETRGVGCAIKRKE